jgi:hypothetical protein
MNDNTNPESISALAFGAEPLASSGFEDEEPDPAFESEFRQPAEGARR